MASVQYLADLSPHPDGVKLQLLHILRGTKLGQDYLRVLADRGGDEAAADRAFGVLSLDQYCHLVDRALAILPSDICVHRITGDGPKKLLLAPKWSADKRRVLNYMAHYEE